MEVASLETLFLLFKFTDHFNKTELFVLAVKSLLLVCLAHIQ